jgi:Chaperone of endosialidase
MRIRSEIGAGIVVAFVASLVAPLVLGGCPGGDDGDTGAGSTSMSASSTSVGSASSGSTTQVATSQGTTLGSSGADDPGSSGVSDSIGSTTQSSSTGADSGGSGSSGTTGAVCVEEQGSCAQGEMCCVGLECCAGVPVPPGQEYCGMPCPRSDHAQKREFAAVDADAVLERVLALPITTWSYHDEDPSIRHLGPMAQDFQASFGLGASDKAIFQIDADGVALTSIQAVTRRLQASEAENAALRESLASLQARVAALEAVGMSR